MDEISAVDFAAAYAPGVIVIDCREPTEYVAGHVPGAVLMRMAEVAERRGEIDADGPVYVICRSGNRSRPMSDLLRSCGLDAWSVAGGTVAWSRAGGALVTGSGPG